MDMLEQVLQSKYPSVYSFNASRSHRTDFGWMLVFTTDAIHPKPGHQYYHQVFLVDEHDNFISPVGTFGVPRVRQELLDRRRLLYPEVFGEKMMKANNPEAFSHTSS